MATLDATEALIASLELDERGLVLAEVARSLARTLDGEVGREAAGIAKELRVTLSELMPEVVDDDDDDWTSSAGTPSGGNGAGSVPGDVRQ